MSIACRTFIRYRNSTRECKTYQQRATSFFEGSIMLSPILPSSVKETTHEKILQIIAYQLLDNFSNRKSDNDELT